MSLLKGLTLLPSLLTLVHSAPTSRSGVVSSLPTVDLGYEIHQALVYNDTYQLYNFSNIPYAAPPVGDLRFAAPQSPPSKRDTVNLGDVKKTCPNAGVSWSTLVDDFAYYYAEEETLLGAVNPDTIPLDATTAPFQYLPNPEYTEDCLVLDVVVPVDIFNGGESSKAPVLVEIYGGGFVGGDKSSISVGTPEGLLHRSNNSFVYVTLNYRLGAFGWLAGPEFQAAGGVANAGLLDQRFALEWVKRYIHLFGGDPDQVTLIGESAGGSSIMHQITAYGGADGSVPFKRAIPQSPGFTPTKSNSYINGLFNNFLKYANASSLEELRGLSTEVLQIANAQQIYENNVIGSYTYGPVVDGSFVPDIPGILLANGQFDQSVSILAGHNLNEGWLFTSPYERNNSVIISQADALFSGVSDSVTRFLVNDLYPAIYNGSQGYKDWWQRATQITTDSAFACNAYYMTKATSSQSYGYLFDIFPAFHGQDVPYTFFQGTGVNASNFETVQNANTAYTLQDWIITFTINGKPTTTVPGSPNLPIYGNSKQIGMLTGEEGVLIPRIGTDNAANARCDWWQLGLEVNSVS